MQKAGFSTSKTLRSCRILPVSRSTQTANSSLPSARAVVIQIWPPQTTGDAQPLSWMGVFQTTFSFSPQRTGNPTESERPSPRGPRNCGQFSPAAASAVRKADTIRGKQLRMAHPGCGAGEDGIGWVGDQHRRGPRYFDSIYEPVRRRGTEYLRRVGSAHRLAGWAQPTLRG